VRFEDDTYFDKRVLLSIPSGFNPGRQPAIVVFFHGNNATLERDVVRRQQVANQLARSGLNAVLVAPQFAVDTPDSSAGRFWEPGFFRRFLEEAAEKLAAFAAKAGNANVKAAFENAPVIVVAYSGGYDPAAYSLQLGGAENRVRGVILLDALFGEIDKFAEWIAPAVSSSRPIRRPRNQRTTN
jgi:poly(3-hydroxybutyrate) depolymerase